ncbi:hypothetical protein GEMRC1_013584 [Eukaryota sp. GEM-RC1]
MFEKMAVDSQANVAYVVQDDSEIIYKLDNDTCFEKKLDEETCQSDSIPDYKRNMIEFYIAIVLPPEDVEKGESKTVNDVECDVYQATVTIYGASEQIQWCIADGFVIEVDDGKDKRVFTNHEEPSEDSK